MEYEDRSRIGTSEGVELALVLSGLGSRALAAALDYAIKLMLALAVTYPVVLVLAAIAGASGDDSGLSLGVAIALIAIGGFFLLYGYEVFFEAFRDGRTPGKQVAGLRTVLEGGEPIGFKAAAVRNLVRLVDGPLTVYIAGVVSIVVSRRNQRLGDIAAGTIVVRERFAAAHRAPVPPPPGRVAVSNAGATTGAAAFDAPRWDVSGLSDGDLATVRGFLTRRGSLDPDARHQLAGTIAERVRPLVAGSPGGDDSEAFLEAVVRERSRER